MDMATAMGCATVSWLDLLCWVGLAVALLGIRRFLVALGRASQNESLNPSPGRGNLSQEEDQP